jgi:hypothetical protein
MSEEALTVSVLKSVSTACERYEHLGYTAQGIAATEWLRGAREACDCLIINDGSSLTPHQIQRAIVRVQKTIIGIKAIREDASPTNTPDAASPCPRNGPKESP